MAPVGAASAELLCLGLLEFDPKDLCIHTKHGGECFMCGGGAGASKKEKVCEVFLKFTVLTFLF